MEAKKNAPAKNFYREHGFEVAEENEAGVLWRLDLSHGQMRTAEWIRVTVVTAEQGVDG